MKYIMFEVIMMASDAQGTLIKKAVPIIFPEDMVHREMASAMRPVMFRHWGAGADVRLVAAGFYDVNSGEVHGESETLHVRHRPEDKLIIKNYSYEHGII